MLCVHDDDVTPRCTVRVCFRTQTRPLYRSDLVRGIRTTSISEREGERERETEGEIDASGRRNRRSVLFFAGSYRRGNLYRALRSLSNFRQVPNVQLLRLKLTSYQLRRELPL